MNIHVVFAIYTSAIYSMNNVKMFREQKNMSQLELGLVIGVSQQEISLIEKGKREDITCKNAAKYQWPLAKILKMFFLNSLILIYLGNNRLTQGLE
ncbi:helix-turn-helix transcriptional regulator [Dehalobacter sp. TBBPA1]|uniref:helix-turn-helix transcriptional regulator n=1 Tax=Dehalobacter sp. TBBPA1 TaxID=3235037 RepID=UPI0034A4DD34